MAEFKKLNSFGLVALLAIGVVGCGSSSTGGGGKKKSSMDAMAEQTAAQSAARKKQEEAAAAKAAADQQAAAAQPVEPEIQNVDANSMKKGQTLRDGSSLKAVFAARFWAEHQMILNNITHAMQLYYAEKGYYPKTQEQFMNEIIKPNEPATKLPELKEGWEYFYDPQDPLQLKMINKGGGDPKAIE
jgi:hypothetical protein